LLTPGGGMKALREAMMAEAARRARKAGLIDETTGKEVTCLTRAPVDPETAMRNLREAMLSEQIKRAEWIEANGGLEALAAQPAVHDDEPDEPEEFTCERDDATAPAKQEE
jgi:hypothetical protein